MRDRIRDTLRLGRRIGRPLASFLRSKSSLRKIRRLLAQRRPLSIELGAGNKRGQGGWTTIDMTAHCDLFWDLRRGLPFPEATVGRIYSSHFFEHLSFQEAQRFLEECRRVLVPAGSFSICVPNARLYIEAYMAKRQLDPAAFLGYEPAYHRTTPIDYVNYIAYMDGQHKHMFDEENLLHILTVSGFRNARRRAFDPSLDIPERRIESIYAEAEK